MGQYQRVGRGNWDWRVNPRGQALDELSSLQACIGNAQLYSDSCDRGRQIYDPNGCFSVKRLTMLIQKCNMIDANSSKHHELNSWFPIKVNY